MSRKRLLAFFCALVTLPVFAADDERWYKVELLVFTRDPVVTTELFPPSPELAYPSASRYLHYPARILEVEEAYPGRTGVDEFGRIVISEPPPAGAILPPPVEEIAQPEESLEDALDLPSAFLEEVEAPPLRPTPFVALAADFRELGASGLRLSRSAGATVQFHETWLQPIPARAEALPLVLDESGDLGEWPELQGTVLIHRSRYLHIEANLWRNTRGQDLPAAWRIAPPPLGPVRVITEPFSPAPLAPVTVTAEPYPVDFSGLPLYRPPRPELTPVFPYRHAITFEQRRRMKRNELHYIDHPAMGILIKITALDEDALESWAEAELMQSEEWPASLRTRAAP